MTYQNDQISKDDNQRYQVVRRYGVSKTSVSFKYQLKRLCDVLSWSVSVGLYGPFWPTNGRTFAFF